MNERIIELHDIAPKEFWGAQDTHLETIKKYYPKLKIVARGTTLKAFGEKEELDEFENRFNRLMLHFTRYNNIDANVIDRVIQSNSSEEQRMPDHDKILVHGIGGKLIKAMTPNQQKLVDLVTKNDMVFAVGPAGTGKTYTAKDVAEKLIFDDISADKNSQKIRLDASGQFKLVQFHPSYTYEDFVRGIIAESNNNQIEYLTVNRVFADFCLAAYQNLKDSLKKPEEITREQWLLENFEDFKEQIQEELDESNGILELNSTVNIIGVEDDAFRYTGNVWKNQFRMKYSDIIKLYNLGIRERREIKHEKSLNSLANQHSTYFKFILDRFYVFMQGKTQPIATVDVIQKKNFIMVIDEMNRANLPSVLGELIYGLEYRDESFDTMYDLDGNKQLIIPSNLFIIGTMNTADRSVGHIDYAIRRRFAFVDILPTEEPINTPEGKELFRKVSELFVKVENGKVKSSDHLSPDFNYKEVQLGHSYFIGEVDRLSFRMEYEIKPILREYLKDGILMSTAEDLIESL